MSGRYRVADLFAGAGGMALGFHRAGWETAWTAELAPFPSRVTKHHWPDDWTNVPDEKGKPASDAVRYKAIGNGVVSNVAQWIAARMRYALDLATAGESEAA